MSRFAERRRKRENRPSVNLSWLISQANFLLVRRRGNSDESRLLYSLSLSLVCYKFAPEDARGFGIIILSIVEQEPLPTSRANTLFHGGITISTGRN